MDGDRPSERQERWRRVLDVADQALELDGEERAAFVERFAAIEPALGEELRALLASAEASSLLDEKAASFAAPLLDAITPEYHSPPTDSRFGAYRILGLLGRGGMGAVYVAERADDQYRKRVALKLPPPWITADPRRVQRFVEERQILASLDHPDIARLIDGGVTPDGLPWFAMEYVDGVPIDHYCDDHCLTIEARLELFCRVCSAVQYAHRNLVVHRDLKPSNILVTADGGVKLLDFGIAKLIAEGAAGYLTVTGERMLTPLYASPEQLRGLPVSTATDVYAIGVLLDLLLTGRDPYRLSTTEPHDVARAVLECEPVRPSLSVLRADASARADAVTTTPEDIAAARDATPARLAKRLRGDLDAIVLKAMEKEPARRYGSVEQLETDVRRHLAGLPVDARVGGRAYHARKFLRRHRLGTGIAVGSALALLAFASVIALQSARVRAQAAQVAAERDRAELLVRYVSGVFEQASMNSGDRGVLARDILDSATARIDARRFPDPEQRARLMMTMARAYLHLELPVQAHALAESSLALRRALRPARPGEVAESAELLGDALLAQNRPEAADSAFLASLASYRMTPAAREGPAARALVGLAQVRRSQRRFVEADSLTRAALAIDSTGRGASRDDLAQTTRALARIRLDEGAAQSAARLLERAVTILRDEHGEEHVDVAAASFDLAGALQAAGEHARADSIARYARGIYQRLVTTTAINRAATTRASMASELAGTLGTVTAARGSTARDGVADATSSCEEVSRIAFESDRDGPDPLGHMGNHEIYSMKPDGSDQRRLTHDEAIEGEPVWSPDGARIAFYSRERGGVDIFVMNADGTDRRRVTDLTRAGLGAIEPAWSPDGKRIAFQSFANPDVYVIGADGSGLVNLTKHPGLDAQPAWSPDGRKIAFVSNRDGMREIYIMDADGRNPTKLTHGDSTAEKPVWSPDGRRIAFQSARSGDREIYVMNADGSGIVRLTHNPGSDAYPSWSSDGRMIAFHRQVLGHAQIHVMNVDGSGVRRLTELSPVTFNGFPSWGPPRRAVTCPS